MLHSFNPLGDRTPRRLSAATRELAARYLSGEIGSTLRPAPQAAGDEPYPVQLRRLAAEAETALSPDERLAGAARWLEATFHRFPGTDRPSVSHVTADFRHAVTGGLAGLEADIAAGRRANPEGAPFYDELAACIGAMRLWVERYRAELAERLEESPFFPRIAAALKQVPERPPRDFFEAVQSLWLFWTFQRLAGNWSGLGRIDELLGPFLDADLEAGRLDLGEAREILACFWIKGTEWITGRRVAGGDAQFYQNVILAGTGRDGREVCNRVTMLIFDIVEELHISDFPLGVRLSRKSPPPLLRRVAELQSRGGGIVSIYNEEVVIAALVKFGYPEKEACDFTAWQPDVVVINAGTNDVSGGASAQLFIEGAVDFMEQIRSVYPQAKILWCYGMMNREFHDAVEEAVRRFNDSDGGAAYLALRDVMLGESGAVGHPNVKGHAARAALVTQAVQQLTGWTVSKAAG